MQRIFVFLLLVVFFLSKTFCTFSSKGLSFGEFNGENKPQIISFNDGFFIVASHNFRQDEMFFQGFDANGDKTSQTLSTGNRFNNSISEFSFSRGVIDSFNNKKRFYIFVTFEDGNGEILRIKETETEGGLEIDETLNYKINVVDDIINPRIAFYYYNYDSDDNSQSSDTFLYLYEQRISLKEQIFSYTIYGKSIECSLNTGSYAETNITSSFFGKISQNSTFPTIAVSGNERTENNSFLIGKISEIDELEYIEYEEYESLFNPNIKNEAKQSTELSNITNLKIRTNGIDFYVFFCSNGNNIYAFAQNMTKEEGIIEIDSIQSIQGGKNFDFIIHNIEGKSMILLFYETFDNTAIETKYFIYGDGEYQFFEEIPELILEESGNQPSCAISNSAMVFVWTNTTINGKIIFYEENCENGQELLDGICVCPIGQYDANNANTEEIQCVQCPENYYKEDIGNQNCAPCPSGRFINYLGGTNINQCQSISINNITGIIIGLFISFAVVVFIIFLFFIIIIIVLLIILLKSQKKANRFNHIEGFDLILKEAELEQNESGFKIPKIKIQKSKYIVDFKEIKIIKKIGDGASDSMVYLCDWNGTKCAFKGFSEGSKLVGDDNKFDQFEREVEICVGLNHPSILQFYGASITPKRIGLLIQYCTNGDLNSFLKNRKKKYPLKHKIRILEEIISGMDYLHHQNLIHRDLKPENILLDENEKSKIMDFGLSKTMENAEGNQTMTKMIGTVYYMAPEVIKGQKYSYPCDVYSWSVMAYVLISENWKPYGTKISQAKIMSKVSIDPKFRPQIKKEAFKNCKYLIPVIEKCWNFASEERYSFIELKKMFSEKTFSLEENSTTKKYYKGGQFLPGGGRAPKGGCWM